MDNLKANALHLDAFYQHLCTLTQQSQSQPSSPNRYLIAYSGGLDSHVLLHLLSRLQKQHHTLKLRSLYIDHGLQTVSKQWAIHCQHITTALGISHQTITLNLAPQKGESVEAMARHARYQAFAEHLLPQETLLTAQHQDDQAETVLIQLLRGSGLDGLAAMPASTAFANGYHARPLLSLPQTALERYAQHHQLAFITDPSNADTRFDRNYLRHHITPILKQRWPEMAKTLSRAARFQAEASQLLTEYISEALTHYHGQHTGTLSVSRLKTTKPLKQKALLREWIKINGFPAPSEIKLQHIIHDVIQASADTQPLVHWAQTEIRRYQDALYIMSPLSAHDHKRVVQWHNLNQPLVLTHGLGTLLPSDLGELQPILLAGNKIVTIRFRQGGEKIKPRKRKHHLSLKNLFQEAGIPPWQRPRVPLIYADEQLIQVYGIAKISHTIITQSS